MPRKPYRPSAGGNKAWRALSNKEPKGQPPKVKLTLTPLDVFGLRNAETVDVLQFRGGAGRHGRNK